MNKIILYFYKASVLSMLKKRVKKNTDIISKCIIQSFRDKSRKNDIIRFVQDCIRDNESSMANIIGRELVNEFKYLNYE